MCIFYWQGRDYNTQETWAPARYLIWHKWTAQCAAVWLGTLLYLLSMSTVGLSCPTVACEWLIWEVQKGEESSDADASQPISHTRSSWTSPSTSSPQAGQLMALADEWGLGGEYCPKPQIPGNTRTTQHKDGAKLINLAYKGWQNVRESKCTHLATRVEDKDIHPEQQIVSNTMNTSHPTGRKLAWFYT